MPPPSGIVSWWPGDGSSSDVVGNHNGVLVNGAGFTAGKVLESFNFSGSNQYVNVSNDPAWNLSSNPFSIDLWVKFNQITGHDPFLSHDEGAFNQRKWIFLFANDLPEGPSLRFSLNSPTLGPTDPIHASWNPNTGQWYFVAITRSGITYSLYINGAIAATATNNTSIPFANAPLTIGKAEAYYLNGQLDEVQLVDRALSPSEILSIYSSGSSGKCDPSGTIKNANTGSPIVGATVTLETCSGSSGPCVAANPGSYAPNVNPETTNVTGFYGWHANSTGFWRIHVSALGYMSADSPIILIPPAIINLNITLTPNAASTLPIVPIVTTIVLALMATTLSTRRRRRSILSGN